MGTETAPSSSPALDGRLTLRLLTPPRTGAVAVVELAGPPLALATLLARHLDQPLPATWRAPALRRWLDAHGQALDEVLVVPRHPEDHAPDNDSTTAVAEVHLHGGRGILLGLVRSLGGAVELCGDPAVAVAADWPLAPAWGRGPEPRLRESYERALAEAPTAFLAKQLLAQLDAVPRWLDAARTAHRSHDTAGLAALLAQARAGLHLAAWFERPAPPRVALVGAQNAGKSTLFNALTGQDRVLVSPHAGTTRDPVFATIAVRGLPVELIDTAGLELVLDTSSTAATPSLHVRFSAERLEKRGQLRALRAVRNADLVVLLTDATTTANTPLPPLTTLTDALPATAPALIPVATKLDVAATATADTTLGPDWHGVSAHTGEGLAALLEAVGDRLRIPSGDTIVPLLPLGALRTLVASWTESVEEADQASAELAAELATVEW